MTPIYKEDILPNNKSYSIQVSIDKGLSFLYNVFAIEFGILNGDNLLHAQLDLFGDLFSFDTTWNKEADHAGIAISLKILWFSVYLDLCDTRHWDYDKECWKIYDKAGNPI